MISELKQKVMSDPNVQDAATLVLGVSAGTAGAVGSTKWIDLFSTTVGLFLGVAGLVVTILTGIDVWHKSKQIKIKTARDQLGFERDRLELAELRKTYKA